GVCRSFWIGWLVTVAVVFLAMGGMVPSWHSFVENVPGWVQMVLVTPVVFWCGWPFFVRAWNSVVNVSPNMFTLIALGEGAAYFYSLAATLIPGLFPVGCPMHGRREPRYDPTAIGTTLVVLASVCDARASGRT